MCVFLGGLLDNHFVVFPEKLYKSWGTKKTKSIRNMIRNDRKGRK